MDNQHSEKSIEESYQQIREQLSEELLQKIKSNSFPFFEKLVVDPVSYTHLTLPTIYSV